MFSLPFQLTVIVCASNVYAPAPLPSTYLHLWLCLLQVLLLGLLVQEGDGRLLGLPLLCLLQLEVGGRGAGGQGRPRGRGDPSWAGWVVRVLVHSERVHTS